MPEDDFELDVAPKKKKRAQVDGWMIAVSVLAFAGFAAVFTMLWIERAYMRGEWESETAIRPTDVLLPAPQRN